MTGDQIVAGPNHHDKGGPLDGYTNGTAKPALRQLLCGAGVRFGRKPRLTLHQQQEGGGTATGKPCTLRFSGRRPPIYHAHVRELCNLPSCHH